MLRSSSRARQALVALLLAPACAFAQLMPADPDWKESEAPAPPALRTEGLIPIGVPGSMLRFGVDPKSVTIGADRIVRYVVLAQGDGGAVNAFYEGIRCSEAQVKVYARNAGSGWVASPQAEWQPLHGSRVGRHSLLIARNGACNGHAANGTAHRIVRDLGTTPEGRTHN